MYQLGMNMINLLGRTEKELRGIVHAMGEEPFRGSQLYQNIYQRQEKDIQSMSSLPGKLRTKLGAMHTIDMPRVHRVETSIDGTRKLLLALRDNEFVETVVIPDSSRVTLCISSQVGCGVGCPFCLTAQMGLTRNLGVGEILGQVMIAIRQGYLGSKTCNIVFMGMGEPLYNYKRVMKSFHLMIDQKGMGLSKRRITVSTSGVVPVLERMIEEPLLPNLAISLNATTEKMRDRLIPINRRWPMRSLLDCCRRLPLGPKRCITFEFVLLRGLTDTDNDARRLVRLLRGIRCKINLIPYNPNPGLPYQRPSDHRIASFRRILTDHHLPVFVRRTRGDDISAACGQLAHLEQEISHG
jgi:23S rRNA (adenine2503-C2)-methyltransferase